ncbi:MAG: tandem-95 repeat protein, partial [Parachlamydiaceae bacterium]|nr:tandem-95 repeat protein [Parachlamydiaceae bacterium]
MRFRIIPLEERIVLDAAGALDILNSYQLESVKPFSSDTHDTPVAFSTEIKPSSEVLSEKTATADPFHDKNLSIDAPAGHDSSLNLLVISSDVANDEILAAAAKDPEHLIIYDPNQTSLDQLSKLIAERLNGQQADSIAFLNYGSVGAFSLTSGVTVSQETLSVSLDLQAFWQSVGMMIKDGGRVDLLPCNVAADSGQVLISQIDQLIDTASHSVSVAASTDITANAPQGGDWYLEIGNVDAGALYFTTEHLSEWQGTLDITPTLIKEINPNLSLGSNPQGFVNMNGIAYFAADNGSHGFELWRTDGTTAGTTMVKDVRPGNVGSYLHDLTVVGNTLYFAANGVNSGSDELWKSDGTAAGTVLVADINPTGGIRHMHNLTAARTGGVDVLYFTFDDNIHAQNLPNAEQLWSSLGGIAPGGVGIGPDTVRLVGPNAPTLLTAFNDKLFLRGETNALGNEVWVSTNAPSVALFVDLNPTLGSQGSFGPGSNNAYAANDVTFSDVGRSKLLVTPDFFVVSGGKLYFNGSDHSRNGMALRVTATGSTSDLVTIDLSPGGYTDQLYYPYNTIISNPIDYNGTFIFSAATIDNNNPNAFSHTLWKSNGTVSSTVKIYESSQYDFARTYTNDFDHIRQSETTVAIANNQLIFAVRDLSPLSSNFNNFDVYAAKFQNIFGNDYFTTTKIVSTQNNIIVRNIEDILYTGGALYLDIYGKSAPNAANEHYIWRGENFGSYDPVSNPFSITFSQMGIANISTPYTYDNNVMNVYAGGLLLQVGSGNAELNFINRQLNSETYTTTEDIPLTSYSGVFSNDPDVLSSGRNAILVSGPANGALTLNSNGSFIYTPYANFNGIDTFSYRVSDGGISSSIAQATINVTAVNDAPTNITLANNSMYENYMADPNYRTLTTTDADSGTFTYLLVSGTGSTDNSKFSIVNGNQIVNNVFLNYETQNSYSVRVRTTDSGGQFYEKQLTINLIDVHDSATTVVADSITANRNISGNTTTIISIASLTANDLYTDTNQIYTNPTTGNLVFAPVVMNTLTIQSTPNHGTLVNNFNGTLSYVPTFGYTGPDAFSYSITDIAGISSSGSAQVSISVITPTNDAPTYTLLPSLVINEDTGTNPSDNGTYTIENFITNASAGSIGGLTDITATIISTTNPNLFDTSFGGYYLPRIVYIDATTRGLYFKLGGDATGTATISVSVKDNGGTEGGSSDTTVKTMTITVNPVNDAPTFTAAGNIVNVETPNPQVTTVNNWASNISPGPGPTEASQVVDFIVINNTRPDMISSISINAAGQLNYTINPWTFGTATISIAAHDNGGMSNGDSDTSGIYTFNIQVKEVPFFTEVFTTATVNEDSSNVSSPYNQLYATNISNAGASTFTITPVGNPVGLFLVNPFIDAQGYLHFTTNSDAFGTFTGTVTLTQNGVSSSTLYTPQDLTIVVNNVNDAPRFTSGTDQTVSKSASAQNFSVTNWATGISGGPTAPSTIEGETVSFVIDSHSNQPLLSSISISADGTLSYTVAANAFGVDTVTYHAVDSNGLAGAAKTLKITAGSPPVASNDTFNATMNATLNVTSGSGVLANDTNSNGAPSLTAFRTQNAANGTVTLNADGSFSYTPNNSFYGTDSFKYTSSDGQFTSNEATATITVTFSGTPPFPVLSNDLILGSTSSDVTILFRDTVSASQRVWFTAKDATGKVVLYKTLDGVTATAITNPSNGNILYGVSNVTFLNNGPSAQFVYFTSDDGSGGISLRLINISTGALTSTTLATSAQLTAIGGVANLSLGSFVPYPNGIVFTYNDPSQNIGTELWRATTTGTIANVADIRAGSGSALVPSPGILGYWATAPGGAAILFAADDGVSGRELWKMNTSNNVVSRITDLVPGAGSPGWGTQFAVVGNEAYYIANVPTTTGTEVYVSYDNGFGGIDTGVYDDLVLGTGGSSPANFTVLGSRLYFTASTPTFGRELYYLNSIASGGGAITRVTDINPGASSSFTSTTSANLTVMGSSIYFTPIGSSTDRELWKFDGTTLSQVSFIGTPGDNSSVDFIKVIGGNRLLFSADDSTLGGRLIGISDGTVAGTSLKPLGFSNATAPRGFTLLGGTNPTGRVIFAATDASHGTELWTIDTIRVAPIAQNDTFYVYSNHQIAYNIKANDTFTNLGVTPTYGTVSGPTKADFYSLNPLTGILTYSSSTLGYGTDSLTYSIFDGVGTVTATVTIGSQLDPEIPFTYNFITDPLHTINSTGNFPVVAQLHASQGNILSVDTVSAHGGTITPYGATINSPFVPNSNYLANWTYNSNGYIGSDSFTYTIIGLPDSSGYSRTVTGTVNISVNALPVNTNYTFQFTTDENQTDTMTVAAAQGIRSNSSDSYLNNPANFPVGYSYPLRLTHNGGVTAEGFAITAQGGILALNDDGSFTYKPALGFSGQDSLMFFTSDGVINTQSGTGGGSVTNTIYINVRVNQAPDNGVDTYTVAEGGVLLGSSILANDSDFHGGDPLENNGPITMQLVAGPSQGAFELYADGTFIYTPDAFFNGTDSFTYTTTDSFGAVSDVSLVTINVTSVNNVPVGVSDYYIAMEDQLVQLIYSIDVGFPQEQNYINFQPGVLANDSDAHGGALGENNTPLTAQLVSGPLHASIFLLNSDGTFNYQGATDFFGLDHFRYQAVDSLGGVSAPITVTINVAWVNDNPTGVADFYTVNEDTIFYDTNLKVTDNDLDNPTTPGENNRPFLVNLISGPSHAAQFFLDAYGQIYYQPEANFNGFDSFTYMLFDGWNGIDSNPTTVTIEVVSVSDAPTALNDSYTVNEDTVLNGSSVLANDSDDHGTAPDENNTPFTAHPITSTTNGELVLNVDGTFTYTPNANFNGTDSFTYQTIDSKGGISEIATVNITVFPVNDAPLAVVNGYSVNEDTLLTVAAPGVLANDSDVEGSSLTAISVDDPIHAASFQLNSNGSFTYQGVANYSGADSFTYKVNDGTVDGNTVTVFLTINPVNDAPTNLLLSNNIIAENAGANAVVGNLSAVDVDAADSLTFSLISGAGSANNSAFSIVGNTLQANASFNFEGQSSYSIRVRATDAG